MITKKDMFEFVKGHYYSDEEESILWEPFENHEQQEVQEFIVNGVYSLKCFLKEHDVKVEE